MSDVQPIPREVLEFWVGQDLLAYSDTDGPPWQTIDLPDLAAYTLALMDALENVMYAGSGELPDGCDGEDMDPGAFATARRLLGRD